jgi:hypothetical protein
MNIFANHHTDLNYVPLGTQRAVRDVAHVERSSADRRRGRRHRGRGAGAAGALNGICAGGRLAASIAERRSVMADRPPEDAEPCLWVLAEIGHSRMKEAAN